MFASCDGDGFIDIWDINKDIEGPQVRKQVRDQAINTLKWSQDGKRMAVGDASGYVSIWGVDKDFSAPKSEDFTKMERLAVNQQQVRSVTGA